MKRLFVCAAAAASIAVPGTANAGFTTGIDFVGTSGFDPEAVSQIAGASVRWDNATGFTHTATSYEGVFDTGNVANAQSSAVVPLLDPGRFEYFCAIHTNMRGVLGIHASGGGGGARPQLDARPGLGNLSAAAYTIGTGAVAVSPGLTLGDADSAQIASALAAIRAGFREGDVLEFTAANGITGDFDANSGLLTLTGAASVANYEAALRSVRFRTSAAAGTRRIAFGADDDGGAHAPPDFREVGVSAPPANDPGTAGGGATTTPPPTTPGGRQPPGTAPNPARGLTPPPLLRLRTTTFTVDRKGRVTLRFTTDPSLRGTVELVPPTARGRFGRAALRADARGAVTVRVRLSNAARRSLRRSRTRRLRARVVLRSGTRTASRAVTLRRRR